MGQHRADILELAGKPGQPSNFTQAPINLHLLFFLLWEGSQTTELVSQD